MKRTALYFVAASFLLLGNVKQASACFYIPWLDPLAWIGFYGCGPNPWINSCHTGRCGYTGYNGFYQPGFQSYAAPTYSGFAPSYQPAPAASGSGCGCQGAALPQAQLTAVQVPVTTYRAVTQYVPQTSYRTQYRYQQSQVAVSQPSVPIAYGYSGTTSPYGYSAPTAVPQAATYNVAPTTTYPSVPATTYQPTPTPTNGYTSYNANRVPTPPHAAQPNLGYPIPAAPAAPEFYQPRTFQAPLGDVAGDHELRPQAASIPVIPNSYSGRPPVRRATYGAAPRTARRFPSTVR